MATTIAADTFERAVPAGDGWGSADTGGLWSYIGVKADHTVSDGWGRVSVAPSAVREAYLAAATSIHTHVRVAIQSSSAYSGGTQSINIVGRRVGASYYQARVRIEDGAIRLYTLREESSLGATHLITHTYAPGEIIWVDVSITGTNPATFAAKIWLDGTPEPETYQLSVTDSTAALQAAGYTGVRFTVGSAAPTTTLSINDFTVVDPTVTTLATPVVTITTTPPTSVGGSDGTATLTWPAVEGAHHYESALVAGTVTSGFTADDVAATSPKTYTGLAAGTYTGAVRAKAS